MALAVIALHVAVAHHSHGNTAAQDGEAGVGTCTLGGREGQVDIVLVSCCLSLEVVDGPCGTASLGVFGILVDVGCGRLFPGGNVAFCIYSGRRIAGFQDLVGIPVIGLVRLATGQLGIGIALAAAVLDVLSLATRLVILVLLNDVEIFRILVGRSSTLVGFLHRQVAILFIVIDILAGECPLAVVLYGRGGKTVLTIGIFDGLGQGTAGS